MCAGNVPMYFNESQKVDKPYMETVIKHPNYKFRNLVTSVENIYICLTASILIPQQC